MEMLKYGYDMIAIYPLLRVSLKMWKKCGNNLDLGLVIARAQSFASHIERHVADLKRPKRLYSCKHIQPR